jgi:hypothetical protein
MIRSALPQYLNQRGLQQLRRIAVKRGGTGDFGEPLISLPPHAIAYYPSGMSAQTVTIEFGWDSYDAEPPNDTSFACAHKVLGALTEFNFKPTKIVASVEGGVGFIFTCQDRYADIECLNSGALVAVMYDSQSEPAVWCVSPDSKSIIEALEKIRAFLNA